MSHVRPDRLADLLRGKLSTQKAAAVEQHLAACEPCRGAFARVRAANVGFDDLLAAPTPEIGTIRAEATVRWTRLPERRALRPRFAVAFGLALAGAEALFVVANSPRPVEAPLIVHVAPPRPKPLEATVTLLGGVVQLTRAGATARLTTSMHLYGEDRLVATPDARVAAQWAEGSGFLLLGDAELAIERLERHAVRFNVVRGKLDVRRGPHEPGDALAVTTASHVIRAHGTWFTVAGAQYQTTVEVLEGEVEVTDREDGSSTVLHAPARAVFNRGRVTQSPIGAREAAALRTASEMNLLQRLDGTAVMTVASEPAGTLAVDGVELGPTPLEARRPLGRHYVEIARRGFAPLRRWITLGPEPEPLRVALVQAEIQHEPASAPVEIESMIQKRGTQIRACYERRLKRDPTLAGTVTLRLRVGEAGQVRSVAVEESTLSDPAVGECLRREAAGWSFEHGRNATVVYPFVFRAQ
jgi:ferric-dicitrate binding protein FerR (iron transport regulator)